MPPYVTRSLLIRPRSRFLHCLVMLTAFISACSHGLTVAESPALSPEAQALLEQTEVTARRGVFFEVTGDKGRAYLFGTIHVGKPEFYPLRMAVTRGMVSSRYVAVEADILNREQAARQVTEFALYPGSETLDQHIAPELVGRVKALLAMYDVPMDGAMKMRPWMLGMTLTILDTLQAGYDPGYGADVFVMGFAKGRKKPIVELESLAQQFSIFNGLAPEEQEAFLEASVAGIEDGSSRAMVNALVAAWAAGDTAEVVKIVRQDPLLHSPTFKPVYEKLVIRRNVAMADHIEGYLKSGEQYFVAVGILHLLGEGSVVSLLAERGYTIRER